MALVSICVAIDNVHMSKDKQNIVPKVLIHSVWRYQFVKWFDALEDIVWAEQMQCVRLLNANYKLDVILTL